MPSFSAIAGFVAGVLALIAYIPYAIAILKKQTRPNRATWIIWSILDVLAVSSYYFSGAKETLWVPVGFTLGSTIIVLLSVRYGEKKWSWLDIACLIGAGVSIPIWLMSDALNALLVNLFITAIGGLPTLRKAYRDPNSENQWAWGLFMVSCIANLLAIKKWGFAIAIYPIVILLVDGPIAILVLWPRKKKVEISTAEDAMTNEGGANG